VEVKHDLMSCRRRRRRKQEMDEGQKLKYV